MTGSVRPYLLVIAALFGSATHRVTGGVPNRGIGDLEVQIDSPTDDSCAAERIVWASRRSGNYDVWIMDADGTNHVNLTSDSPADDLLPAISPDGRLIAFSSLRNDPSGRLRLFVMDHDGGNVGEVVRLDGLNCHFPSWTPDGTQILFTGVAGCCSGGLYRVDVTGDNLDHLGTGYDNRPFMKPDVSEIVFDRRTNGLSFSHQIFRAGPDGEDPVQCTFGGASEATTVTCGGYSPSGDKIIFTKGHGLWIMDSECENQQALVPGDYAAFAIENPSFSPNGERILFQYQPTGGDADLYTCRTDGSDLRQMTFDPANDLHARWGRAPVSDCDQNGVADACDLAAGSSQDCNANGQPDSCDMAFGFSHDCDGNGTPDDCQPGFGYCDTESSAACPACDLHCDGIVNGIDIAIIAGALNYGWSSCDAADQRADVNRDGVVNGLDVATCVNAQCFGR